jgi:hypothetical protein
MIGSTLKSPHSAAWQRLNIYQCVPYVVPTIKLNKKAFSQANWGRLDMKPSRNEKFARVNKIKMMQIYAFIYK